MAVVYRLCRGRCCFATGFDLMVVVQLKRACHHCSRTHNQIHLETSDVTLRPLSSETFSRRDPERFHVTVNTIFLHNQGSEQQLQLFLHVLNSEVVYLRGFVPLRLRSKFPSAASHIVYTCFQQVHFDGVRDHTQESYAGSTSNTLGVPGTSCHHGHARVRRTPCGRMGQPYPGQSFILFWMFSPDGHTYYLQ